VQIASGAVGALIIEGDFEDVPRSLRAGALLVLTEAVFDSFGTIENFETLFPETATRFLAVNACGADITCGRAKCRLAHSPCRLAG